jgi:hypothetical protein
VTDKPKAQPDTLEEAIEWAKQHLAETGQRLETVPNPDKSIFFNVVDRTVTRLEWDEHGNAVEVTTSCDTGHILSQRTILGSNEAKAIISTLRRQLL